MKWIVFFLALAVANVGFSHGRNCRRHCHHDKVYYVEKEVYYVNPLPPPPPYYPCYMYPEHGYYGPPKMRYKVKRKSNVHFGIDFNPFNSFFSFGFSN